MVHESHKEWSTFLPSDRSSNVDGKRHLRSRPTNGLNTDGNHRAKLRRKRSTKNYRSEYKEPLPPPPPPPPPENHKPEEELWLQQSLRRSLSSPVLSQFRKCKAYHKNSRISFGSNNVVAFTSTDNNIDFISFPCDRVFDNIKVVTNDKLELAKENSHKSNEVVSSFCKSSDSDIVHSSQSATLMHQELVEDNSINIDRVYLLRGKQNRNSSSFANLNNKAISESETGKDKSAVNASTKQESGKDEREIALKPETEVKPLRPTSLFKPGQPQTFFPDNRVTSSSTGAIQQLAEYHYNTRKGFNMSSYPQGVDRSQRHAQRTRRPLPSIPPDAKREVQYRDIGVMTPGNMEDSRTMLTDLYTPLSLTPGSSISDLSDKKNFKDPKKQQGCYRNLSGKCKLLLLLVPTLVAMATTAVLLLFLFGIIGNISPNDASAKKYVTPGLLDKTAGWTIGSNDGNEVTSHGNFNFSRNRTINKDTKIETKKDTTDVSIETGSTSQPNSNDVNLKSNGDGITKKIKRKKHGGKSFDSRNRTGKAKPDVRKPKKSKNQKLSTGRERTTKKPDLFEITGVVKTDRILPDANTTASFHRNKVDVSTNSNDASLSTTKERHRKKKGRKKQMAKEKSERKKQSKDRMVVDNHGSRASHISDRTRTRNLRLASDVKRARNRLREVSSIEYVTKPPHFIPPPEIWRSNSQSSFVDLRGEPYVRASEVNEAKRPEVWSRQSVSRGREDTAISRLRQADQNADEPPLKEPPTYEYTYNYDQYGNYEGEPGSAYTDDVYTDDDELVNDEDFTNNANNKKSTKDSCHIIQDPVCDAVLPYPNTYQDNDLTLITTEVTSLLVSRLRRDGESGHVVNETFGQRCDPESALRFLCALQYPNCLEDSPQPVQLPCLSWCREVLTSCLSEESIAILDTLRHGDVVDPVNASKKSLAGISKASSRSRKVTQSKEATFDVAALIEFTCNHVNRNDETEISLACVDMSTIGKSLMQEQTSEEAQRSNRSRIGDFCGEGSVRCRNGNCIDTRWRCDGIDDCGEWEDEKGCECGYGEYQCANYQCIRQEEVCDGYHDCNDRSDESDCETCSGNLTSCEDGKQCILSTWWCDGDVDCSNGRDEAECSCETKGLISCDDNTCIPSLFVCDGDHDCPNGTDERNCYEEKSARCKQWMMTCDHSCISITHQCDGILDCSVGGDENDCGECEGIGLQTCSQLSYNVTLLPNFIGHVTQSEVAMSSEYLHFTAMVHSRCHPLLQELGCSLLAPPVPLAGATCPITRKNNRRRRLLPCRSFCLEVMTSCQPILESSALSWPTFLQCNSFPEKTNNSLETCLDATTLNTGICSSDEFRCVNTDSDDTQCVAMTSRCDGRVQCRDGSDEIECNCEQMNRFQCRLGGRCIAQEWVCDSHNDCADGSDESSCSNCSSQERSCLDYSCVATSQWCDGNDDCPDGSDETDCLMLVPRGKIYNTVLDLSSLKEARHNVGVLLGYNSAVSRWLPLCADAWDAVFSHLACNQMGFNDATSFTTLPYYFLRHHQFRQQHQPITITKNHRIRKIQESFSQSGGACQSNLYIHVTCRPRTCGRRRDATDDGKIIPRIMGGRTSRENKWPWLASLQLPGMNHVCGATLIRSQWIVSAAHCFQDNLNQVGFNEQSSWSQHKSVALNTSKHEPIAAILACIHTSHYDPFNKCMSHIRLRKDVKIWKVKIIGVEAHGKASVFNLSKIIIHPRYDSQAVDFDIALIKLDRPIRSTKIEPLCLPQAAFRTGSFCIIAGWGLTGKSLRGAHKLKEGVVHVINKATCQSFYPNHLISSRMICAGRAGMIDACSGDSGGPLMCWQPQRLQWQLAGVTSWGSSCTPHSAPGVYTDIKYFSEWAQTTMEQKDFG